MSVNDPTQTHIPAEPGATRTHAPGAEPPSPPETGTLVQSAEAAARAAAASAVPTVPGFAIETELGRGGMGVVYKATQEGLNRAVALKMLLAGPFADPGLRARFLLEAESVAALEHPHIIRVFAFGESGGHPYLAMEFLPGGTLAERIKTNGPLSAKAATELLAKLATAVAHAHSRGVVHRDIKPLNVLLAADGEPRLTDFGLAKVGRADQNLSATGQVLGTPAYMAPEQAAGKVREVGTAADVYALGAVLYDVMTGRPPFRGDSAAVTLQKVLTEEPERPRKLNASIPHDLETICLKCLEKDPTKRYPTAQALADDLSRYHRNEPISVRPAGALERGVKWVKRNKVIAGAIAAVSLALLVGAGVSLGFGLYANEKAEEAKRKQKDAEDAAGREEKEKLNAIAARRELVDKNDKLNQALAQALFSPFAADGRGESLTRNEQESLWEITKRHHDEVAPRVLVEATQTPFTCKQLENRAEYVLHASVGLDVKRRNETDQLLLEALRHEPQSARSVRLALACSRWGCASPALAAEAAKVLVAAVRNSTKDPSSRSELVEGLSAVIVRMDPSEAEKVGADAANLLLVAIRESKNYNARRELAKGLSVVAARMKPLDAEEVRSKAADVLLVAIRDSKDYLDQTYFAQGLAAVTERLEPSRAARINEDAAIVLIAAIRDERGRSERSSLKEGLLAVAARMDPTRAAQLLLAALNQEDTGDRIYYVLVLTEVAVRMKPAPAADRLVSAMGKVYSAFESGALYSAVELQTLTRGLLVVAAKLPPPQAAKACANGADILLNALKQLKGAERGVVEPTLSRKYLAQALADVIGWLEPARAEKVCSEAATLLLAALNEERDRSECLELARSLSAVTARMNPSEAEEVRDKAATLLTTALSEKKNNPRHLSEGLLAVVVRMKPTRADQLCADAANRLLTGLREEPDGSRREDWALGLSIVAARLEPSRAEEECAVAAKLLVSTLREKKGNTRDELAKSLSALATWMKPDEAKAVCDEAKNLLRAARAEGDRDRLRSGVASVVAHVESTRAVDILLTELRAETRASGYGVWAKGLLAVAARMEPARAGKVRADAATVLLTMMGQHPSSAFRDDLASLHHLASGPADVRSAAVLTGALASPQNVLPALALGHPRPLPPQTLVELLKHPFCVGEARRAILDALEFTYKRPFKDQWEFVEFVQKNDIRGADGKPLDLLSPPTRPEPKP